MVQVFCGLAEQPYSVGRTLVIASHNCAPDLLKLAVSVAPVETDVQQASRVQPACFFTYHSVSRVTFVGNRGTGHGATVSSSPPNM